MHALTKSSVTLLLIVFVAGCAGGTSLSQEGTYRQRLGTTTRKAVQEKVPEVLASRYGYRFDRRVATQEDIRYITQWAEHTPLDDEQAQGVQNVRTRILVNARPKNRSANTYTAEFRAEYQVQKSGNGEWVSTAMTEMRREYIDEIYDYMDQQLSSGVRSY